MQVRVTVEGYGTFQIDSSKVSELVNFLSRNESVIVKKEPVQEVVNDNYTGRQLINE